MRVAVVGGKLQGVEACYLARKAGWHIRLVDRRPGVPARGLCDEFVALELASGQALGRVFDGVDLILPALEDTEALEVLTRYSDAAGIPMAFDPRSYGISASKIDSDRLFAKLGLPAPQPFPPAGFPLLAKPSTGSGSRGVRLIRNPAELKAAVATREIENDWVLQEFLSGPSFSLEVMACGGRVRCFQVTDLFMDAGYDCKRVTAPSELPAELIADFERIGRAIAAAIGLRGLMDVEVILNDGRLKVLEIDARLPSQTPTAVFWSSGVNLVRALGEAFRGAELAPEPDPKALRGVVYEHIRVRPGELATGGEHLMAAAGSLSLHPGFFGADEALSDYADGIDEWRATLILSGNDRREAWAKRCAVLADIRRHFRIDHQIDPEPDPSG